MGGPSLPGTILGSSHGIAPEQESPSAVAGGRRTHGASCRSTGIVAALPPPLQATKVAVLGSAGSMTFDWRDVFNTEGKASERLASCVIVRRRGVGRCREHLKHHA